MTITVLWSVLQTQTALKRMVVLREMNHLLDQSGGEYTRDKSILITIDPSCGYQSRVKAAAAADWQQPRHECTKARSADGRS